MGNNGNTKSEAELLKELEELEKKIRINPKDAKTWFDKWAVFGKLNRYEDALVAYNKALEIDSKSVNAWCNKGVVLNNLKRYEEALVAYNEALEINPKDEDVWCNKGVVLDNLKRYEEALVAYNEALEINPKDDGVWYNKGLALNELKRYEEALVVYNKALEINPKRANTWTNKGKTLEKLERYTEAKEVYERLAVNVSEFKEFAEWKIKEIEEQEQKKIEENKKQWEQLKKIDHFQNSIDMLEKMSGINLDLTSEDEKRETIGISSHIWWLDDSFKHEERRWLAGIVIIFLIFACILIFSDSWNSTNKENSNINLSWSISTWVLAVNLSWLEKETESQFADINWKILKIELFLLVLLFFAVRQYSRAKALRIHTQYTLMNTYTLQSLINVTVANNLSPAEIIRDGMKEVFISESDHQKSKSDLPIQEAIKLIEVISKAKESDSWKPKKKTEESED